MMISRTIVSTLGKCLDVFPAVTLLGPRQVGKTTLAKGFAAASGRPWAYLDLESSADRSKLREPVLFLETLRDHLVVLDEIQAMPSLFGELRGIIDAHRVPGRFILLGSASPELRRHSAESLAGRITTLELPPFLLGEIDLPDRLWFRGGFPLAYLASTEDNARLWLNAFVDSFLYRDLPAMGIHLPAGQMHQFWEMLAHLHGQTWNASRLAANFGLSVPTIKRHLAILESTFMVRQLQPYLPNVSKRLVKAPKVYLRDSGILHAILRVGTPDALLSHPVLGASYEGWVVEQICGTIQTRQAYFYRTHGGAEIDLVIESPKGPVAVEVKRSLTPEPGRGMREALVDIKPAAAFVVYPGNQAYPMTGNVNAIPLPLLLDLLPSLMSP